MTSEGRNIDWGHLEEVADGGGRRGWSWTQNEGWWNEEENEDWESLGMSGDGRRKLGIARDREI